MVLSQVIVVLYGVEKFINLIESGLMVPVVIVFAPMMVLKEVPLSVANVKFVPS